MYGFDKLPVELRATYERLSAVNWHFLEHAAARPEFLARSSFRLLAESGAPLSSSLQSWPTFIDKDKVSGLAHAVAAVAGLVKSIPARVFAGDPRRIGEFYLLPAPLLAALILEEPNGIPGMVLRGDFIPTASGLKCLELNVGANLGGLDVGACADLYLQMPVLAEFFSRSGLRPTYTDPLQLLLTHIASEALRLESGELNIAAIVARRQPPEDVRAIEASSNRKLDEILEARGSTYGGQVRICTYDQLAERRGEIWLGEKRIMAVLEMDDVETSTPVFRAFKMGKVRLYNGPVSALLSDKRNLALLSQLADSGLFDAEERRLIAEYVPWTRLLAHHRSVPGLQPPSRSFLLARREDLVIKHARKGRGDDVYIGSFTPAGEWESIVDRASAEPDWIVQERCLSLPYLYRYGEHGSALHHAVWGLFLFGKSFGGSVLRMGPAAGRGIINVHLDATWGGFLEVEPGGDEQTAQRPG